MDMFDPISYAMGVEAGTAKVDLANTVATDPNNDGNIVLETTEVTSDGY